MSTMPPAPMAVPARTPVAPAASAARATVAEDAPASGTVADVFAALVDALTAQLDGAEAEPVDGDTPADREADASAHAAVPGDVSFAPVAIAPVVPLADAVARADDTADGLAGVPRPEPAGGAIPEVVDSPVQVPTATGGLPTTVPDLAAEPVAGSGHGPPVLEASPADLEQGHAPLDTIVDHDLATRSGGERMPAGDPAGAPTADVVAAEVPPPGRAGDRTFANPDASSAVAPVVSASPTAAPASDVGSATTARPSAPALPEQLVEVLAPVRRGPDGDHRMSLQLRPEELGDVRIDVRVRGGEISLNLRADLPATSELLRDSLRELRVALEAAGFRSGELDVGSHARGGGATPDGSAHRTVALAGSAPGDQAADAAAPRARPAATAVTPTTGLDLRL